MKGVKGQDPVSHCHVNRVPPVGHVEAPRRTMEELEDDDDTLSPPVMMAILSFSLSEPL